MMKSDNNTIDTFALLRQVKIALITDEPNQIVDLFNNIWNQLTIVNVNVYHTRGKETIYYKYMLNKKVCIFYHDETNGYFWCNYVHYWSKLPCGDYLEASEITKLLVEDAFLSIGKRQIIKSPNYANFEYGSRVYKALREL